MRSERGCGNPFSVHRDSRYTSELAVQRDSACNETDRKKISFSDVNPASRGRWIRRSHGKQTFYKPVDTKKRAWIVVVQGVAPATLASTLKLYACVESPRLARLCAAITAGVRAVEVRA